MFSKKVRISSIFILFLTFFSFEIHAISRNKLQGPTIYRYVMSINGVKLSDSITYPDLVARPLALFYSSVHWNKKGYPERTIDFLYNDFAGVFDFSQTYELSSDNGLWVTSVQVKDENLFSVEEPEEISEALKELEEIKKEEKLSYSDDKKFSDEKENPLEENVISDEELLLQTDEGISLENLPDLQSDLHGTSDEDLALVNGSLIPEEISKAEKRLKNSENQLRLHIFDEEVLGLQNYEDGKIVIISDGKKIIRKFLDANQRMYKNEIWKTGKSLSAISLVSTENFEYENDEAIKPKSKNQAEDDSRQKIVYDEKYRVKEILNYGYPVKTSSENKKNSTSKKSTDKNESDSELKEKLEMLLLNKTEYKYNDDNKILEKKYTEFDYSEEKYGKITASYEKKDVYDYKNPDFPPDYYYYDDGKLCLKTIYSDVKDYVTVIYFEGDIRVENHYTGGKHTKDFFFVGNKLKRTKNYEK